MSFFMITWAKFDDNDEINGNHYYMFLKILRQKKLI